MNVTRESCAIGASGRMSAAMRDSKMETRMSLSLPSERIRATPWLIRATYLLDPAPTATPILPTGKSRM